MSLDAGSIELASGTIALVIAGLIAFLYSDSRKKTHEIVRSNRLKDEFLCTLSHELRTPANVILGFSELMQSGELTAQESMDAVRAIHRNARAQTELINQMLDLSQIITGQMNLAVERTNVTDLLTQVVDAMTVAARSKCISIKIKAPETPVLISVDRVRIRQVIWNLLSNAVKFTPPEGSILITLNQRSDSVEFSVTDTGEGIQASYLPFLFRRFSQQDGSYTRKYGGMGLGLSIVRHLTELHGGTVEARSAGPGRGSTFTVSLPQPVSRKSALSRVSL